MFLPELHSRMCGLNVRLMGIPGSKSRRALLQAGREVEPVDVRCVQVGRKRQKNNLPLQKFIRNLLANTGITKKITNLT